jgi:hypothetical protein
MSIRNSIAYVQNPSGTFHLYSEAGGGDICINVFTAEGNDTYYGDMYLTIKELEQIHKEIGETLDWYHKANDEAKMYHMMCSHKYDDDLEPEKEEEK